MKRLLIVSSEYPPMKAGIANLTHSVYSEFRRQGEDVFLLAPQGSEIVDPKRQFASYHRPARGAFQWHVHLRNSWILRQVIQRQGIQRVLFMDASARCLPFPWVPRIASVIYVNGTELIRGPFFPELASGRFHLLSRAYRTAQAVFCISEATRNLFRSRFPQKHAEVLYPCFDEKRVYSGTGKDDNPFDVPKGTLIFLTVSRLTPRKGHELVLGILSRIRNDLPPFKYYIVGRGPDRERLEALVDQFDLAGHVVFTGAVSDEELKAYYHHADIFIMLSQTTHDGTEGFGLTFVEASASGTVVAGSDRGGVVEAVKNGVSGIILPTDSPELAATTLLEFSRDQGRRDQMRRTGPVWARENFSSTKMFHRWKELIGESA